MKVPGVGCWAGGPRGLRWALPFILKVLYLISRGEPRGVCFGDLLDGKAIVQRLSSKPVFAVALEDPSFPQALPPVLSRLLGASFLSPNVLEKICCTFWFLIWETGNTMWKDCPHLGGVQKGPFLASVSRASGVGVESSQH